MNTKEIIKNAISEIIDSTNSERACIRHESSIYIEGTNIRIEFALTPIKDTKKFTSMLLSAKLSKKRFIHHLVTFLIMM